MPIFTVRIFKNLNGLGSNGEWVNTYDVDWAGKATDGVLQRLIYKLAQKEAEFHTDRVVFSRASISTFIKGDGGDPENPSFDVIPLGFNGLVATSNGDGHQLPGEVCVVVASSGLGGRQGRNLYRHAIGTGEWTGDGGSVMLTQAKRDAVTNSLLHIVDTQGDNTELQRVIPSKTATGYPGRAVEKIQCTGTQLRQRRQQRRKKSGSGDMTKAGALETELADMTANVDQITKFSQSSLSFNVDDSTWNEWETRLRYAILAAHVAFSACRQQQNKQTPQIVLPTD